MSFSDLKFEEHDPDFPDHRRVREYLTTYAKKNGLSGRIFCNTLVEKALRENNGWSVWLGGQEEARHYDAVVVCTGQFAEPILPKDPCPKDFGGQYIHAMQYKDPVNPINCKDAKVIVVGLGASGVDIAMDIAEKGAAAVWLSARSGRYLAPKFTAEGPLDRKSPRPGDPLPAIAHMVPQKLAIWASRQAIRSFYKKIAHQYGSSKSLGFEAPDFPPWERPPTITNDLRASIKSGKIIPKKGIIKYEGKIVHFADGSKENADIIIYSTGYRWQFPFLNEELGAHGEDALVGENIFLERRIAHPKVPNLYFIGFCKQLCSIFPLAEEQARWLAASLRFPDRERMPVTKLSEPFGTICNFYVNDLRRDFQRENQVSDASRGGKEEKLWN